MVVVMADVDITSLSVEISAESQGAELNIDKLATAISNLRTKGNVTKVVNSLDKLAGSIATLKQASAGMSGLDKITSFLNGLSNVNTTASAKSINTVVNAIKKIPAAVSGLNGVDFYSMSGSITQLTNALAPLSILDASNLKALGSAFNAIGKVPDLTDKLKATDLDSFASSCQKISVALTPLASQLDKVGNAFAKLPPQLSKVVTQANRVTAANEKQRKSYLSLSNQMNGFMRNMAKLVSLKAIADYLGNAVAKFNDFYEAANMFGVSMGDMTNEASGFIDKMEQLLGIDPSEAMNAMANIYSMTKSFGLAKEQAYTLSKSLTQLGYDLSSLKNIPISQAFTKIRSAMAGELEPMLQLGVDISQARLQQELLALGFNKQVSTLSQADKATLRYIAILKQTTDAQGDFARTLSSPANMIRILKAQLSGLARDVGSLLYPAMKSILPPLIAAVELIREFVQWVAKLMGVKVVLTDFAKSADSVGGIGDAMDETTDSTKKAAKALKDYTMGFDELNIIDPTQGSSGSGAGAGAAGNLLGDVDLSGYDMFKQYNEELAKQIDASKQKIKAMLPLIATVATALAAWKLTNLITDIVDAISKMNALKSIVLGLGVFTVGIVLEITGIKDAIENGVNGTNFAEIVLGALIGTTGAAILGKGIARFIVTGFGNTAVGAAIKAAGGSTAGAIIGAAVGGVVTGIPMFVTGVYDAVKNGLNTLNGILIPLGSTMTGAGIGAIIGSLGGPIGTGIGALIGLIVGGLTDVGIAIYQNWDKITESLGKASESLKNWFVGVGEWWNEKWQGFSTNFQTAWKSLPGFVQHPIQALNQASAGLKQWFVGVGEWWNQKWAGFKENWDKAWNSLVDTIKNLPAKFLDYGKNIVQGLIDGINNGIENAKKTVGGLAKAIIDKFTTETDIHSPSKLFEQFGIYVDQGLANGISAAIPYVSTAMQGVVAAVQEKGQALIAAGSTQATNYVTGFLNGLDTQWQQIDQSLQSDFFGSIGTLWNAISNGDLQKLGTWAASYFYHAMDDEQRKQIKSIANNSLQWLTQGLSGVWNNIAGMASSFISQFVPSAMAATSAQTSLNIAMDANPVMLVISLIGMLVGALVNFANKNKSIASFLSNLWYGIGDFFSIVFETILRVIGTAVQGFVDAINALIWAWNKVPLHSKMDYVSNPMYDWADKVANERKESQRKRQEAANSSFDDSKDPTNYEQQYKELLEKYKNGSYPGTKEWDKNNGTSSGSYGGTTTVNVNINEEKMRESVYNGTYNAFLDIFQRYGDELTGGKELKIYLDGKQITASVEKRQNARGQSLMGSEVYSY
nr:MAG TPA: tail tape measure protein [Caudoviricetes sp.]